MTLDWTHGPLAEGLRDYNATNFFAAHEAWESVWLTAPQPEKLFLQALIQIAVALHHFSRGNRLGATRLLQAAQRKLEPYPHNFANVNVSLLRNDIRDRLEVLSINQLVAELAHPAFKRCRYNPCLRLHLCLSRSKAVPPS